MTRPADGKVPEVSEAHFAAASQLGCFSSDDRNRSKLQGHRPAPHNAASNSSRPGSAVEDGELGIPARIAIFFVLIAAVSIV
jgi:hypothetical protein